jgi:hypothetical protein
MQVEILDVRCHQLGNVCILEQLWHVCSTCMPHLTISPTDGANDAIIVWDQRYLLLWEYLVPLWLGHDAVTEDSFVVSPLAEDSPPSDFVHGKIPQYQVAKQYTGHKWVKLQAEADNSHVIYLYFNLIHFVVRVSS